MSKPGAHIDFQYQELSRINDALGTLRRFGISELDPAFQTLNRARYDALRKIGLVQPRTSTLLKIITGLSPGELRLFRDAEIGWLVQAIAFPGALPLVRYVDDEMAVKIIKGELTHDEFMKLQEPVEPYMA